MNSRKILSQCTTDLDCMKKSSWESLVGTTIIKSSSKQLFFFLGFFNGKKKICFSMHESLSAMLLYLVYKILRIHVDVQLNHSHLSKRDAVAQGRPDLPHTECSWGPYHSNSLLCPSSSSHHGICFGYRAVLTWGLFLSWLWYHCCWLQGSPVAVQPQRVSVLFHFRWAVVRRTGKRRWGSRKEGWYSA